jgi:hypothetical protein
LLSGLLLDYFDWQAVNYFAIPFLLAAGGAIIWLATRRRVDHSPTGTATGATGSDPRSPWSKSFPKRRAIPAVADDRLPPAEGISSKSRNHDQRA